MTRRTLLGSLLALVALPLVPRVEWAKPKLVAPPAPPPVHPNCRCVLLDDSAVDWVAEAQHDMAVAIAAEEDRYWSADLLYIRAAA